MTRRAFLALRVIQAQRKFDSNMEVQKSVKIDQKNGHSSKSVNSFQFFHQDKVKSYPRMVSLCPSMRFRKIPQGA